MNKNLLTAANEACPEMIEKTAAIIETLERNEPWLAREVIEGIKEITGQTGEMLKTAGVAGNVAMAAGGSLLLGLGAAVAGDVYDLARRGLTKGVNYRRIMKENPDLKGIDKERVEKAFNAIHRYGPEFTADPMMGGSLIRAVADSPGGLEHQLISGIISSRKNLADAKGKQFGLNPSLVGKVSRD